MSKKGPSSTSISVADGPSMFSVCSSVLPVCPSLSPVCFSVLFICLSVSPLYLILSVFYHHVSAYLPAPRFRLSFYFSVCVYLLFSHNYSLSSYLSDSDLLLCIYFYLPGLLPLSLSLSLYLLFSYIDLCLLTCLTFLSVFFPIIPAASSSCLFIFTVLCSHLFVTCTTSLSLTYRHALMRCPSFSTVETFHLVTGYINGIHSYVEHQVKFFIPLI